MSKPKLISPIAIDLGAKNTGVYFAHYPAGSSLDQIDKKGKVYQLDNQGYTYLMANRTAARHQRRGYDRRQMAKRLFKLIWCEHFGLVWNKDVQQTIGFLLNRRGFSFLAEGYKPEILSRFPKEAFDLLPDELQEDESVKRNEIDGTYNFANAVQDWAKNEGKLKEQHLAIQTEIYLHKLYGACLKGKEYKETKNAKNKLRDINSIVYKKLIELGVQGLEDAEKGNYTYEVEKEKDRETQIIKRTATYKYQGDKYNLQAYVRYANKNGPIKQSIEDIRGGRPRVSLWDFKPSEYSFDSGEDNKFAKPEKTQNSTDEQRAFEKAYTEWQKIHLHHLAFALYEVHNELESGGRHRSKYFQEAKDVLENANKNKNHMSSYVEIEKILKRFCDGLQSGEFREKGSTVETSHKLTIDNLPNLIGHVSNLELKLLRKYFNDEKHKNGDYWCEKRFTYLFGRWIISEWRVGEKDRKKRDDNDEFSYKKLKELWKERHKNDDWKMHSKHLAEHNRLFAERNKCQIQGKGVIEFFLENDPQFTIPPYQDNNNRRPPKCQSLILNVRFLEREYGDWQTWLSALKELEIVQDYLGDYKEKLEILKGGGKEKEPRFNDNRRGKLRSDSGRRSMAELDARILQFIFDRVKDKDPLNLNEIYSHAKKIRQNGCQKDEQSIEGVKEAKIKLEEAIKKAVEEGGLPKKLWNNPDYETRDLFPKGSFFHLVCKYYKFRQRAKDGRIFIHPYYHFIKGIGYKDTGRFYDKEHLLTYCNHKPRQKRYQILEDLAETLFTTKENLESKIGLSDEIREGKNSTELFDMVEKFFDEIKHKENRLKGFMDDCAKAQKDYRGALKIVIDETHENYEECQNKIRKEREENGQTPYRNNQLRSQAKKELVEEEAKNSKSKKSIKDKIGRLIRLKEKSLDFAKLLAEKIHDDIRSDEREAIIEKFDNPFSLAKIYNIAYKERYGNSKTCPVCSVDNARRMDAKFSEERKDFVAKASRLPAIPTRVIDGAVRRIARIVGGAIAKDKWERIEKELDDGHRVFIPIITESNQFEFEPSREELITGKGEKAGKNQRPKSKPRKGKVLERGDEPSFEAKESRIRRSGRGVCPYTGNKDLEESGEIDHIIPRKSKRGTLNDEANLIWASIPGNQHKTNVDPSLANLDKRYKEKIFPDNDDKQIESWIVNQIGDGSGEFKFGKYRSFNNLSSDEQIAFRHALFLKGHPLRKKVIAAIDNRNRTFVNGTQRYFAEVLANNLYKLAKSKRKEELLSFDYFEVPAYGDIDSVHTVRKKIENLKDDNGNPLHLELQKHKKHKGKEQALPSHLIDAEAAFMIALSKHYQDGAFKINVPYITPTDYADEHGVVYDLYGQVKICPANSNSSELRRWPIKPDDSRFLHRPVFNSDPGGWHFLKLVEILFNDDSVYLQGFVNLEKIKECLNHSNWKEALEQRYGHCLQEQEGKNLIPYACIIERPDEWLELYRVGDGKHQFGYGRKRKQISRAITLKVAPGKVAEIKIHNINKIKVAKFLIKNFNTASNPENWREKDRDVCDKLCNIWYHTKRNKITAPKDFDVSIEKFKVKGLLDSSLYKAWNNLKESYAENYDDSNEYFRRFLRQEFLGENKKTHPHQKVRKHFSLPSKSGGQGWFLVRRKTWDMDENRSTKFIYQCLSESNDFSKFASGKNNEELLAAQYRRKHIFMFPKVAENMHHVAKKLASLDNVVDSEKWYERGVPKNLEKVLSRVENRMGQDAKRACFRLTFTNSVKLNSNEFKNTIKEYRPRGIKGEMFDLTIQDISSHIKCLNKEIEDISSEIRQEIATKKKDILKQKQRTLREELNYCQKLMELHSQIENYMLVIKTNKSFSSNPDT